MGEAYDSIRRGLEQAIAHGRGEDVGAAVHEVPVPEPDVASIRHKTGLSQAAFARSIGISADTLKGWEQGRRRPQGPARVLLALIERRPSIVRDELLSHT